MLEMNCDRVCIDSIFSNEDHARAMEDVIRTAIEQVIRVFRDISGHRFRELQMMVAEKEEENSFLKTQMECAERELMSLRRLCYPCGGTEVTCGLESGGTGSEIVRQSCSSNVHNREDIRSQSDLKETFTRPCDGLTRHIEPQEPAVTSHLQVLCHSEDHESVSNNGKCSEDAVPRSTLPADLLDCTRLPVKKEPLDFEEVKIKWEVCEGNTEGAGDPQLLANADAFCRHNSPVLLEDGSSSTYESLNCNVSPSGQPRGLQVVSAISEQSTSAKLSNREKMQRYRARIRADPQRYQAYRETNRRRYQMRKRSISDLPEQCQRLLRAAWREAARRHRARKKSLSCSSPHEPRSKQR